MTLDGFLTVLTLILAALAIIPNVVRLRLRLRWKTPAVISLFSFAAVIYLEFYNALKLPCFSWLGSYCDYLILASDSEVTPSQWAFVIVIVWLIFSAFLLTRSKLSASSLSTLSELVSQLVYERRYAELVPLLEPVLPLLVRAASRQLVFQRLRDWFEGLDRARWPMERFLSELSEESLSEESKGTKNALFDSMSRHAGATAAKIAYIVPSGKNSERAAKEILRVLFRTPAVLEFVSTYRPEFAVKMLACDITEVHDFCDVFLVAQISSPQSLLFQEISQNQNVGRGGYFYPEHNLLLHFLFASPANAERLGVYKPIGDYVLAKIRPENSEYISYLNGSADLFQNDERWQDSTFVAIRFFDLMVSAAMWGGIKWHMWLFYLPPFIERLVDIYDASKPEIDESAEFPTRAAYLISETIRALLDWVSAVPELPEDSPHRTMENSRLEHENGNIPKSAAIALGQCTRHLMVASNVSEKLRSSMHDTVMRHLRDLQGPDCADIRAVMIASIINGGPLRPEPRYGDALVEAFMETDHVVREYLDDYKAALAAQYGPLPV